MKTYKRPLILFFLLSNFFMYAQTLSLSHSRKPGEPFSISNGSTSTSGVVYLDLKQATSGSGYVDIPVSFSSTDSIVSLDLALKFNETVLSYNSIASAASHLTDILAKYSADDKILRLTSNSQQYYTVDETIAILRFNKTGTPKKSDLSGFTGYLNGDKVNTEIRGNFPFRQGKLMFWSDNSPIIYNPDDPDNYLITNIYGVDSMCSNKSLPTQPDVNGQFSFITDNGPFIQIERDILPSTNVQPVINGFDASLAHKVLINDPGFIPTIYQAIALDVNADGVISAGDVSQLNLRSVKTIAEFKQKWNYTNNGSTNGEASKDWLFLDSASLALPAYRISVTYPYSDGQGFSKSKVPVVPFCLQAPQENDSEKTYIGVLLGDANGNYTTVANDGKIKRIAVVKK